MNKAKVGLSPNVFSKLKNAKNRNTQTPPQIFNPRKSFDSKFLIPNSYAKRQTS